MLFVPLSNGNKRDLKEANKIYQLTGRVTKLIDEKEFPCAEINQTLAKFPKTFVKSSFCSFKNAEVPVQPVTTFGDLYKQMVKCRRFYSEMEYAERNGNDWQLVFSEWINCPQQFEFRVFVHNGRVKGISQQLWYKEFNWITNLEQAMFDAIVARVDKFVKDSGYAFCTIDVFYVNNKCHIIEVNPPCLGGFSTGSALFNWYDHTKWKDPNEIFVLLNTF